MTGNSRQEAPGFDLPGQVLRAGDPGYADATATMIGAGSPDLVVRPRDAADVASAVRHAVDAGLSLSVQSGGHSMAGLGSHSDGLLIDLSPIDGIEVVDRRRRLVRVGGGATWGQVAGHLQDRGLGLSAGDTAQVGVGGLTLGGGIGWMVRRHGLAIDQLAGAQVVTADGRIVRASPGDNDELFWALRGGGGNFGVVVGFDFVAQPVTDVVFGTITFEPDDPAGIITRWRDAMRVADERLTADLILTPPMFGRPAAGMVTCCFCEPDEAAAADAIAPLRAIAPVTKDGVQLRRYADVLESFQLPPGIRMVLRNAMIPDLSAELIAKVGAAFATNGAAITLRSLGGAVARVPSHRTAFAHRDAEALLIYGSLLTADATARQRDAVLLPWPAIAAHGTGSYVNFLDSATEADTADCYPGDTHARLARVKRTYDPGNVFRRNHNIEPAR